MSRAVMQQALEALTLLQGDIEWTSNSPTLKFVNSTITALRSALAEPDSDYERGFVDGMNLQTKGSVDKAVNRIAEPEQIEDAIVYGSAWSKDGKRIDPMSVYKEPEQEPVAWMYDFLNPNNREEVIRNWVTQNPDDIEREKGFNVRPLYTAPTPNTLEESNGQD